MNRITRCVVAMAEATLAETETKLKELQTFRNGLAANLRAVATGLIAGQSRGGILRAH
jgi:hypothetical protein